MGVEGTIFSNSFRGLKCLKTKRFNFKKGGNGNISLL